MFALLFGVGFYIFLERLDKKNLGLRAMDIYARRMLWLFVIGIAHAYLVWNGDVLYHYAICGLLLVPFRSLKTINLLFIIAFLCFLELNLSYEQTIKRQGWKASYAQAISIPEKERTKDDLEKIEAWENRTTQKAPDTSRVEVRKKTYWVGLKETYQEASAHKGVLYYRGLIFRTLIVMIIGIVLYRSGIFQNYLVWKHYWLITLTSLILGLTINYVRFYHWTFEYDQPVLNIWKEWLFTFPKEVLGVAYILLFNGIYQKFLQAHRFRLVSNIGRTALTNYIFQNVLLGFIFYGYGLAQYNQFSRFQLLGIVGVIWIIQLVLCWLWLRKYQQGPLEWTWKKLTYSSFQKQIK